MSVVLTKVRPVLQSFKGGCNDASEAQECQINIKRTVGEPGQHKKQTIILPLWSSFISGIKKIILYWRERLFGTILQIQRTRETVCFPLNLFIYASREKIIPRERLMDRARREDITKRCAGDRRRRVNKEPVSM